MSCYLWKFYLEDDLHSFYQLLEEASTTGRPITQKGNASVQSNTFGAAIGSPGSLGASPKHTKNRGAAGLGLTSENLFQDLVLSRSEINRRDAKGLTILHHAASTKSNNSIAFAVALIEHPLIDLYVQDPENGWTALHRAFYFGNISMARAILDRDARDTVGHKGILGSQAGTLRKIKDREGNGPYDLLTETIKDRTLRHAGQGRHMLSMHEDDDDETHGLHHDDSDAEGGRMGTVEPPVNVQGDEFYTFGSNKNITLGFSDEDDRQNPERVKLKRPEHLYQRFLREHIEHRVSQLAKTNPTYAEKVQADLEKHENVDQLPSVIRARPIVIRDVQMSKFHTAVLTTDPESNLYMCGYGLGGRLGTGSEKTQFNFTCIESGALAGKKVVAVALGQNHSLAISDEGEIFSWGSNPYGQVGYELRKPNLSDPDPIQTLPRQIYGPLKREVMVGVAASRIHSVAHTSTSLFTWGKNEGQLGLVDADARSLDMQTTPRKVAASLFSYPIHSVSAIDRATTCLLENHEVWVFANYGWVKLQFPLDGFTNYFLKASFLTTKYDDVPNQICKITSGGDTICALSSAGEIYAATVTQRVESGPSNTGSTTNPSKIRGALTPPARIWSLKKAHMNARDVGVDQDGSIILTTEAGSVWQRVKRPKIKSAELRNQKDSKKKDYKFSRVPGLSRVMAVRASAFGGYCAIRRDCDVLVTQIAVRDQTLSSDMLSLLSFRELGQEDSDTEEPTPILWSRPNDQQKLVRSIHRSEDLELQIEGLLPRVDKDPSSNYDMFIGTTVSDVRIPIHQFVLTARSRIIRETMEDFRLAEYFSIPDLFSMHAGDDGRPLILFQGLDFLTITDLVLYIYTDTFVAFWQSARQKPALAYRYRQIRSEMMKLASRLELSNLESATRRLVDSAEPSLHTDLELAIADQTFFHNGDVKLKLADKEILVHSAILSRRCPFFEGLFEGRAAGRWLSERRALLEDPSEVISVDMQHIEWSVFQLVLRHIYADSGEELFDQVVTKDREEFVDLVIDVLSVANELMLDRLSQICQKTLGRHVNLRNACQLLNAIAPSSVSEFKSSCLEYICLSLEALLSTHYLDELDDDLLLELDQVVRENQFDAMPHVRSGAAEIVLLEDHPELTAILARSRQAKLDALTLQTKYYSGKSALGTSLDEDDYLQQQTPLSRRKGRSHLSHSNTQGSTSPVLSEQKSAVDMMFNMDEEVLSVSQAPPAKFETASGPMNELATPVLQTSLSPDLDADSPKTPTHNMLDLGATRRETDVGSPALAAADRNIGAPSRPWAGSSPLTAKLDLKDIMRQTSSTRSSNIALALALQASKNDHPGGSFAARASQRERRKQQLREGSDSAISLPPVPAESASKVDPKSPWKQITRSPKAIITDGIDSAKPQGTSSKPPTQAMRSVTTPQLTMRQTVAKNGSATKQKTPTSSPPAALPQRSVSSPQVKGSFGKKPEEANHQSHGLNAPGMTADLAKSIPIQSIRHLRRPGENPSSSLRDNQSLADILSQQQAEKIAVKDATTKRSLQEIQQEQEFQQWWDQESRRVMEEEAAAAKAASSSTSRPRGRGGGQRGGQRGGNKGRRGRGKEGTGDAIG